MSTEKTASKKTSPPPATLGADLTAIEALTPSNNDVIQRKAGSWTNRTPAQLKTDLSLTSSDVGLDSVTNDAQEKAANKDVSGGYVGKTLQKINFRNVANTFTSFFTNSNTAARTYTLKDADGTVAFTSDITGTNSGTNTGDETAARIGSLINGSTAATPNDTDLVATAETSVLKKITWTNVKAFLKTYFDTLYQASGNYVPTTRQVNGHALSADVTVTKSDVGLNNVTNDIQEKAANKDVSGGYTGLTLFKINFRNVADTFTSFFTNSNTAARTYTFQNRNGTIADDTDLGLKADKSIKINGYDLSADRTLTASDVGAVSNINTISQSIMAPSVDETIVAGYSAIIMRKYKIASGKKLILSSGSIFRIL